MKLPKWIFIPIYGAVRSIAEHAAIAAAHRRAADARDYETMNRLFAKSWPAMDRATAGLWISAGEVLALILIGAIVAMIVAR